MLQIEVIGNIGADAEIKEFGGKKYVSFNVAHSERRKDASGTTVESTNMGVRSFVRRWRRIDAVFEAWRKGVCSWSYEREAIPRQEQTLASCRELQCKRNPALRHQGQRPAARKRQQ